MSGMTTANSQHLTRAEIWSSDLKETLNETLMATKWVKNLDGFPDGNTFTIPSIGDFVVDDYTEDQEVIMRPIDTGEFQFSITDYKSSGTYITKKNEQDMFYTSQLVSSFVPGQERAIMERYEADILALPETIYAANAQANINGAYHRFSGGNSGVMELQDFAYAKHALKKANVPMNNLVAIVDSSIEYDLNTLTNIVDVSNNPRWEGVVAEGMATGMNFVKNIYGFDVYTSEFLTDVTDGALNERDGSTANDFSSTAGKANLFFSADQNVVPFISAWRQDLQVEVVPEPLRQRTGYITTCRYGKAFYRPENMVTVVTTPTV